MAGRKSGSGTSKIYSSRRLKPIDRVASRVVDANKVHKPNLEKLRKKAAMERDPEEATRLLEGVKRMEKADERAKNAQKKRLVGPAAEERARKALEAAKWRRDNS